MRRAPDFDLPVGRLVVGAEHRGELDRHRGADRRGQEFILAGQLYPHGAPRHLHRDVGCVERAIVGGVVAVRAGALAVKHRDLLGFQAERLGEPVAQDRRPLGVRPHLQRAVLELGERAGRPDRAIGEERARIARGHGAALRAALLALLDGAAARRLRLQPLGRADAVGRRRATLPLGAFARGLCGAHHGLLIVSGERDELAVTQDFDRRFGGLAHRRLVERCEPRALPGLAQHPRMDDALHRDVVDKGRALDLGRQVEPGQALADDLVLGRAFGRRGAARAPVEVDGGSHRPVVAAGRLAAAQELPFLDRQFADRAAQRLRDLVEQHRAHLGADQPDRRAADRHRIAARGEIFGRAHVGLAGHQADLVRPHVELLRRDLRHRGQDALADLDLAGGDADLAGLERDPLRQDWIVGEAERQRVGNHVLAPLAFCTARTTRLWMPQRHRCGSRASTMSARLGFEFFFSRAVAAIRMPGRQ